MFRNQLLLTRVSGLLVLAMALFLLGSLIVRAPWLYQERRFHPDLSRFGPLAVPVAGVAFGFGWTPCIGPVLCSVLAVAAARGDTLRGATLLAAYSAGRGIPFLATGLAYSRLSAAFAFVKRHFTGITSHPPRRSPSSAYCSPSTGSSGSPPRSRTSSTPSASAGW